MSSKRRRKRYNSLPILIVFISVLLMAVILGVFFDRALKAQNSGSGNSSIVTQTGTEVASAASADSSVNWETASTPVTVQESPIVTDLVTEIVTPLTESPQTTQTADSETTAPATENAVETVAPVETEGQKTTVSVPDTIPTVYNEELLSHVALPESVAADDYIDHLIFFGDSTTYGMKYYKVFGSRDTNQVWTPTSGTLALFRATTDLIYDPVTGQELSLADICATEKPEYLIVTLGVNGISFMDETYFKTEYQNVVNTILQNSPATKLILQSIYPVAKSYENQTSINNTKIQAANEWIVEIASAYGLPYLNTYSALVGSDGYLPESYQNGDGMHMNESGFAVIIDYVKTHPLQ